MRQRGSIQPQKQTREQTDDALTELEAKLEAFAWDERADRKEYWSLCRAAMEALADAIVPDAKAKRRSNTLYWVESADGAFEVKWIDSGIKRFWNLYVYAGGATRWSASVIDAAHPNRVRFEICYDRDLVRTEDIESVVRAYDADGDVRLFTAGEDVGQQSGLTLRVIRDVLRTATERRRRYDAAAAAALGTAARDPWWSSLSKWWLT